MLERNCAHKPAASEEGNLAVAGQAEIRHKPSVDIEAGTGRRADDGADRPYRRGIVKSEPRPGAKGVDFDRAPIAVVVVRAAAAHRFAPGFFLQEPGRWHGRGDAGLDLGASAIGKRLVELLAARLARIGLDIDPGIGRPCGCVLQIMIDPCKMRGERSAVAGLEVAEPRTDQRHLTVHRVVQINDVLRHWGLQPDRMIPKPSRHVRSRTRATFEWDWSGQLPGESLSPIAAPRPAPRG